MNNEEQNPPKVKIKLRSTAVAFQNEKVLIYHYACSEYWSLPGGRMKPNEDSRQALVREMFEETGHTIQIKRLLWISENFFSRANGKTIHEVSFYYLVDAPWDNDLPFEGTEKNTRLFFRWVKPSELTDIALVPAFLKLGLSELPDTPEHLITRKIKP